MERAKRSGRPGLRGHGVRFSRRKRPILSSIRSPLTQRDLSYCYKFCRPYKVGSSYDGAHNRSRN